MSLVDRTKHNKKKRKNLKLKGQQNKDKTQSLETEPFQVGENKPERGKGENDQEKDNPRTNQEENKWGKEEYNSVKLINLQNLNKLIS